MNFGYKHLGWTSFKSVISSRYSDCSFSEGCFQRLALSEFLESVERNHIRNISTSREVSLMGDIDLLTGNVFI